MWREVLSIMCRRPTDHTGTRCNRGRGIYGLYIHPYSLGPLTGLRDYKMGWNVEIQTKYSRFKIKEENSGK